MATPAPIVIFGATGLTGAQILQHLLLTHPTTPITTISRRAPSATGPNLTPIVEPDSAQWAARLAAVSPAPSLVVSALGTTRVQAGSVAAQWKIDHDLNVELVGAARRAGARSFLFVSSAGTRGLLSGVAPYSRMKVGVEEAVKAAGFARAVILRPGALIGAREGAGAGGRPGEGVVQTVFGDWFGRIGLKDKLAVDAVVVGRAAARCVQDVEEGGKVSEPVWTLENADIIRLGRDEWQGKEGSGGP